MMCPAIDNPGSCEIRAVIRFLRTKNVSAAETRRELCAVYGQNVMSEGCSKMDEQMFTKNGEVIGRPSVVSDDLVQIVDQKICARRRFTISELSCNFPLR
jgi:hypothetical protein